MYVWSHLPTILNRRFALLLAGLLTLFVALTTTLFFADVSLAAPGINQKMSFQGRLLTSSGGLVPDGRYNMQFKIYEGGSGAAANNPDGSLSWTESYVNNNANQGVVIKNGYFSVELGSRTAFGSNVDWNDDTLWLSINIAGSAADCTTFNSGSCTADGEMLPMKRLTSTPYAMNAGKLGGIDASGFIQNTTTPQNADFTITGTGTANTLVGTLGVVSPSLDRANAGTLTIGGVNATTITMGSPTATQTLNIGTGSGNNQINLGSTNSSINLTGAVTVDGDITVSSGNTLTLVGGTTAERPVSPADGTLFYDTDTDTLLVYSGGRWRSAKSTGIVTVAPSDATQSVKDASDYVADGTSDQVEINAALSNAAGGEVYLHKGTFTADATIPVPNNTTLRGAGRGTVITLPNSVATPFKLITNSTTDGSGTGVVVKDLRLDGNKANQSADTSGIWMNNLGATTETASSMKSLSISNVWSTNWYTAGIVIEDTRNASISNVTASYNDYVNVIFYNSAYSTLVDSSMENSGSYNVLLAYNTRQNIITGNLLKNSGGIANNDSIYLLEAPDNAISNNKITDSSATSTNYAINISDSLSSDNYLSNNTIESGSINDLGTNTVLASQTANSSGDLALQPAGNIKLLKNTDVTGTLSISDTITYNGIANGTGTTVCIDGSNQLVRSNGTSCTNPSSAAYKENVVTISDAKDKLSQLRAVSFDWKDSSGYQAANGGSRDFGLIAQEVAEVMPELVQYDETGGIIGLNYTGLIPYLLAGAQDQQAEIDDLKAQSSANAQLSGDETNIRIGANSAGTTVLTLDQSASAPTNAMVGGMYYDSTLGEVQCYEADGWGSCGASPDTFVTLSPEYSNAVMNGADIGTITSDLCSDHLNVNDGSNNQPTICGTDETYNFYNWTSEETTDQVRSIYVTHQLPANFKEFVSGTTSLLGRTDGTDASVTYQIYRDGENGLVSCSEEMSVSAGVQTTWQKTVAETTNDPVDCGFEAGDSILFRINLSAKNDANAYVSNLNFTFSNN